MKSDWYKIAKVVIAVIALFLFYLYALNDRYYINSNGLVVDKWKSEAYPVQHLLKK